MNIEVARRVWAMVARQGADAANQEQLNSALILYLRAAEVCLPPLLEMAQQQAVVVAVEKHAQQQPRLAQQVQAPQPPTLVRVSDTESPWTRTYSQSRRGGTGIVTCCLSEWG